MPSSGLQPGRLPPLFLGPRSALQALSRIFLPFVCQSSMSRDKKRKLELKAKELKLHDVGADLSLGDNSNGKEKGGKNPKNHFRSLAFETDRRQYLFLLK